jgi:hypothetical protein
MMVAKKGVVPEGLTISLIGNTLFICVGMKPYSNTLFKVIFCIKLFTLFKVDLLHFQDTEVSKLTHFSLSLNFYFLNFFCVPDCVGNSFALLMSPIILFEGCLDSDSESLP